MARVTALSNAPADEGVLINVTEQPHQRQLVDIPQASFSDDYLGSFPRGVMPTLNGMIECEGNLLIVRRQTKHSEKIDRGQDKLWRALVRFDHPDAPGSVTVCVLWGVVTTLDRRMVVYDRAGVVERNLISNEEVKRFFYDWWRNHGGRPA